MFTAILVVVAPFMVNAITGLIKMLPTFSELRVSRRPVIRMIAALVSFTYVVLGMWIDPSSISDTALVEAVSAVGLTVVAWFTSQVTYTQFFKK